MSKLKKDSKAQYSMYENVEYKLTDKNGNAKEMFHGNMLCNYLLKKGIISPYWRGSKLSILSPFLGSLTTTLNVRNLVTNAGFAGASSRLNGAGAEPAFTYIAVGTGTTASAVTDTILETEETLNGLARALGTASQVTTTVTNDTAQVANTFSVTGTVAVTESGLLNASSAGTLLCRQVFTAINVVSGDSLSISWKIKSA